VCSDVDVAYELTQTVFWEARLLDDGRFEEWLELLADDVEYVAPIEPETDGSVGPSGPTLTFFDDTRDMLEMRVMKVRTGLVQSEVPASRTVRIVSNVMIKQADDAGEHPVSSALLIYRHRHQRDVEIIAGHRDDIWRRGPAGWRLARRRIRFAANVLPTQSLSLFY
jgi:3-phenylpropionate/cinnamic acid dioxygenase small subunit